MLWEWRCFVGGWGSGLVRRLGCRVFWGRGRTSGGGGLFPLTPKTSSTSHSYTYSTSSPSHSTYPPTHKPPSSSPPNSYAPPPYPHYSSPIFIIIPSINFFPLIWSILSLLVRLLVFLLVFPLNQLNSHFLLTCAWSLSQGLASWLRRRRSYG